jgi:acyl-CoA synthetase (AMP-forming)/AMP-acid ligase II
MRQLSAVCLQKVPRVASRRSGNGRSLSSGGRVSSRNRFALPHQQHAQPLKARAHPTRHSEKLTAGKAERCESGSGTPLVSHGMPGSPMIRIVDPETRVECPARTVGEIWVHGENVATGYWRKLTRPKVRSAEGLSLHRLAHPRGLGCAPGTWDSSLTTSWRPTKVPP